MFNARCFFAIHAVEKILLNYFTALAVNLQPPLVKGAVLII